MSERSFSHNFLSFFRVTPRSIVGFLIVIATILLSEPNVVSLKVGVLVSGIGYVLRLFASSFKYSVEEFSVRGPYRFVRHPHHLGSLLLVLGLCIASRNIYLLATALVVIGYLYNSLIRIEEDLLQNLWGNRYLIFKNNVSAIFPQLIPFVPAGGEGNKYSLKKALMRSKFRELSALVGVFIAFLMIYWKLSLSSVKLYYGAVGLLVLVFVVARPLYYQWKKR